MSDTGDSGGILPDPPGPPKTCGICKWFNRYGDTPERGECKERPPEPFGGEAKWQVVFTHTKACKMWSRGSYQSWQMKS